MQRSKFVFLTSVLCARILLGQADTGSSKQVIQTIRELGKRDDKSLPALVPYLTYQDRDVRAEAVKAIVKIDTMRSLDPLLAALKDSDSEIQQRAIDGIVNAYVPGYVAKSGIGGYFTKGVRQVKSFFTERNDTVVDPDVKIRADIGPALSDKIINSPDMDVRSNAALAAGILRAGDTVPALEKGLRAKNSDVIFECLIALQKIRDTSAGPSVNFLARDLDDRVQATALETIGVLHSTTSAEDVRYAFKNARNLKIQRAALETLAMLALPEDRALFQQNAGQTDAELRASSLEGLARLREPDDFPKMKAAFDEADADWRVHSAAAFGMVMEGDNSVEDLGPLLFLVEGFSLKPRAGVSAAYLSEVARSQDTRNALAKILPDELKDRKIGILDALSTVNAPDSLAILQQYTADRDKDVAFAAMHDVRLAQSRPAL
jgi:HEAT repeat protein